MFRSLSILVMYRLGEMARRHKDSNSTRRSDDTIDISSETLLRQIQKPVKPATQLHLNPPKFQLHQIQDDRSWHPKPQIKPAGALKRSATRLVVPKPTKASPRSALPHQVAFSAPKHVLVCIRRRMRKQVLFAKRLNRKGSGSRKHRTAWSEIKC